MSDVFFGVDDVVYLLALIDNQISIAKLSHDSDKVIDLLFLRAKVSRL